MFKTQTMKDESPETNEGLTKSLLFREKTLSEISVLRHEIQTLRQKADKILEDAVVLKAEGKDWKKKYNEADPLEKEIKRKCVKLSQLKDLIKI
jgi:regulator of replication initiation timing